jgi:hypothetical protein
MKRFLLLCALAMTLSTVAMANIIPINTAITPNGSVFTWTYDFGLAADQNAVSGVGPMTRPDRPVVQHTELQWSAFVTIYDFNGYVAGSCSGPTGWTCSAQLVGYTPDNVSPADNPEIYNITWAYTSGPTLVGQPNGIDLGLFTADSTSRNPFLVSYTSRGTQNSGPQAGFITDNVGNTQGPAPTPEPASLILLGAGLLGLSTMIQRREEA